MLAAYGFTFFAEFPAQAKEADVAKMRKRLTTMLMILGGLLVVGLILNDTVGSVLSGFMFQKEGEFQQFRQHYGPQAQQALAQLRKFRFDLFWKGYVNFAIIAGASVGLIILYLRRKVRLPMLAVGLALITVIDLWMLDEKYINPKIGRAHV